MALKNMQAEPKRELIEQAIGVGVLLFWLLAATPIAAWLIKINRSIIPGNIELAWVLAYFAGIFFVFVSFWILVGAWHLAHAAGEAVSALMTTLGWDPRPKQRYILSGGVRYLSDGNGCCLYDAQRRPIRA